MSPLQPQRVVFRADASAGIGTGHVVRCLTLAGELRTRGWEALLTGHMPAGLADDARRAGVSVAALPAGLAPSDEPAYLADEGLTRGAALVATDHYALDADWHAGVAYPGVRLMAIDDLAARPQHVDLLLNQNLGATTARYRGLVPRGTTILAGPRFALLRPEFAAARAGRTPHPGRVERVLVFMSGADEQDVTRRAAKAAVAAGAPVDVVVGSAYPFRDRLEAWAATLPDVTLHVNTPAMAHLMAAADLAIGAPSSASWERCTLGLPTVLLTLAENQVEVAGLLARAGAAVSLGWHTSVTTRQLEATVLELGRDPQRLRAMSRAAARIADGLGARRVADAIAQLWTREPVTTRQERR